MGIFEAAAAGDPWPSHLSWFTIPRSDWSYYAPLSTTAVPTNRSWTQTGTCPHCGAPIYLPTVWCAVTPPPPHYTCRCVAQDMITASSTNVLPAVAAVESEAETCAKCGGTAITVRWCRRPNNITRTCYDVFEHGPAYDMRRDHGHDDHLHNTCNCCKFGWLACPADCRLDQDAPAEATNARPDAIT